MNNVYVRSKISIGSISRNRILSMIPLIFYGLYLNGYKVFITSKNITDLFKPFKYILAGILIGIIVNLIFTKKEKKMKFSDILFSSFHIEYGIIIGSLMSNTVNVFVFGIVTLILFIISKLINIKINVVALDFIIIYIIQNLMGGFSYNVVNTTFTLKDCLSGNIIGGIFATSFVGLLISYLVLKITNSSKTDITLYASISYAILCIIYGLITKENIMYMITINSYLYAFMYVATDSLSSSYTLKGTKIFGMLVGILTFILYFINNILGVFISILIASLLHVLIDKIGSKFKSKN